MAEEKQVLVTIHSRNNRDLPATKGTITRVDWSKEDRTKNALKAFGIMITFTFCSVFIPFLHFILVPSLFVASFVVAMDKYSQKHFLNEGTGPCPKCGNKMRILKTKFKRRITDKCSKCGDDVEITLPEPETT